MGQFVSKFLGNSGNFLEFVNSLISGVLVVEQLFGEFKREPERGIISSNNLILRHTIEVLSSEETTSKRAPSDQAKLVILEQLFVFNFKVSSHKHIVLVLTPNGLMEV